VSRFASPGDAIAVVQFGRAVHAETDSKSLGRKKSAPVFIDQQAVCLHSVKQALVPRQVPALQGDDLRK
jgi:hypothetical protein